MDPAIAGDPQFADFISGNLVLDGSVPVAHRYGGYQFGYWVSITNCPLRVPICHISHNAGRSARRRSRPSPGRVRELEGGEVGAAVEGVWRDAILQICRRKVKFHFETFAFESDQIKNISLQGCASVVDQRVPLQ